MLYLDPDSLRSKIYYGIGRVCSFIFELSGIAIFANSVVNGIIKRDIGECYAALLGAGIYIWGRRSNDNLFNQRQEAIRAKESDLPKIVKKL